MSRYTCQSTYIRVHVSEYTCQSTPVRAHVSEYPCHSTPVRVHLSEHTCQSTRVRVHLSEYTCQYTCQSTRIRVHLSEYTCQSTRVRVHLSEYTCQSTRVRVPVSEYSIWARVSLRTFELIYSLTLCLHHNSVFAFDREVAPLLLGSAIFIIAKCVILQSILQYSSGSLLLLRVTGKRPSLLVHNISIDRDHVTITCRDLPGSAGSS